jgi:hypothetical protein
MREWCEAQAQYDYEVFPGGMPYYVTGYRMYHAGRAIFAAMDVEPAEGRYSYNKWYEEPNEACQGLLTNPPDIKCRGRKPPNGHSEGYYFGRKITVCGKTPI